MLNIADTVRTRVGGRELPPENLVLVPRPARTDPWPVRLGCLVVGLALFVTALGLMKTGTAGLIPALRGSAFTDNAWSTLGVGWFGACVVLSGSPVAASALTLLDGDAIDRTQAFTMLAGSRLGASFVVLVVGVVYAMRHRGQGERRAPVSIGVLSLLMTAVVYLPGAAVGYVLLDRGWFDGVTVGTSPGFTSATDAVFGWAGDLLTRVAPDWLLFPVGLGLLLLGFKVFDRLLPDVGADAIGGHHDGWHTRVWPMFAVGAGVTVLTLSVSMSLTLLVPLVASGRIRRSNTLPYIAGANITTLIDTLVAAIVIGNQDAVRVVVAVTAAVTVWTLALLTFAYPLLRRTMLAAARTVLVSNRRLATFTAVLLVIPLALIAV